MAALPIDPPPSGITLRANQPTAKSRAINGVGTQTKSSGIFLWEISFSYALLDFSERNKLMAFLIGQQGRALEFDVQVPTHSENESVLLPTSSPDTTYTAGTKDIALTGVLGVFEAGYVLKVNGEKATYMVTDAGANIAGTQALTILPPLRKTITTGNVILTKNVPFNVSLEEDSIDIKSKGMSSSISFKMTEEIL